MGRIADLFTGGKYSKALKERDRLADAALGASGYSKSQTEAMRMARELARGRQAQLQGQAMSSNMPLGQRMALAAQNVPTVDAANMFHSLDTAGVKAAENRVAQQQANAMNSQARIGQALESGASAIKNGLNAAALSEPKKAPVMGEQIDASQAPEAVKQSMQANAGKYGMPSNIKY